MNDLIQVRTYGEARGSRAPGLQRQAPSLQQVLERRLAWEIRALQSSKEQLLTEGGTPAWAGGQGRGGAWELGPRRDAHPSPSAENLARAKLEQVEQKLGSSPMVQGALAVNEA